MKKCGIIKRGEKVLEMMIEKQKRDSNVSEKVSIGVIGG